VGTFLRSKWNGPGPEARSPQITAPARLDHARWRIRGSPLRGAGPLNRGRHNHGRRRKCVALHAAAGICARREDGAQLSGGLAPGKFDRRPIHPLSPDRIACFLVPACLKLLSGDAFLARDGASDCNSTSSFPS